MKENSIEKDIRNAEHFISSVNNDKSYKEEGWHGYDNTEIVELARMLEYILLEYKNIADERNNLLVKNQELKEVITKMAEYIASKDIDEDVCKKVRHGKYCEEYGENSNCKECVIEFFKGEVNK